MPVTKVALLAAFSTRRLGSADGVFGPVKSAAYRITSADFVRPSALRFLAGLFRGRGAEALLGPGVLRFRYACTHRAEIRCTRLFTSSRGFAGYPTTLRTRNYRVDVGSPTTYRLGCESP